MRIGRTDSNRFQLSDFQEPFVIATPNRTYAVSIRGDHLEIHCRHTGGRWSSQDMPNPAELLKKLRVAQDHFQDSSESHKKGEKHLKLAFDTLEEDGLPGPARN